jgi:hypothetical protein
MRRLGRRVFVHRVIGDDSTAGDDGRSITLV